jgi:hypothetical protein
MPKNIGFLIYLVETWFVLSMRLNVEFMYMVFTTDNGVKSLLLCLVVVEVIFHRVAWSGAPNGSSPWGYSRVLVFEYRLKNSCIFRMLYCSYNEIMLPYDFSIGCTTSTPDGSSLRGYDWVLAANYRLKNLNSSSLILYLRFFPFKNHDVIVDGDDNLLSSTAKMPTTCQM